MGAKKKSKPFNIHSFSEVYKRVAYLSRDFEKVRDFFRADEEVRQLEKESKKLIAASREMKKSVAKISARIKTLKHPILKVCSYAILEELEAGLKELEEPINDFKTLRKDVVKAEASRVMSSPKQRALLKRAKRHKRKIDFAANDTIASMCVELGGIGNFLKARELHKIKGLFPVEFFEMSPEALRKRRYRQKNSTR